MWLLSSNMAANFISIQKIFFVQTRIDIPFGAFFCAIFYEE